MPPALAADLWGAAPLVWLFGWSMLLLLVGVLWSGLRRWLPAITGLGLGVAVVLTLPMFHAAPRLAFAGMARLDGFAALVIVTLLLAAALVSALAPSNLQALDAHPPESYALLLMALLGMLGMAVACDLMFLFIALEIMSVAAYVLTALNRGEPASVEGAIKYFVMGAFSSATLLYGLALVYGAAGGTSYAVVAAALEGGSAMPALLAIGLALVGAGFAFKVAAVPFHFWVPDVYQAAPGPVAALFATGIKVASFAAFMRFVGVALLPDIASWAPILAVLAIASLLVGNLAALVQSDLKRLLAFSAIGHTGFLLMGLAGAHGAALSDNPYLHGILYYFIAYTLALLGSFAVVGAMVRGGRESTSLSQLSGLARRRPWVAVALGVCLLSLAGLPPTMGFLAKLTLFLAALEAGQLLVAVVGAVAAVLAVATYLRPVVFLFMTPTEGDQAWSGQLSRGPLAVLALCVTLIVLLGVVPAPLLQICRAGLLALGG